MSKKILIGALLATFAISGIAISMSNSNPRSNEIIDYKHGHWHDEHGMTHDAPQHSGGTDKFGCHNASVPYHCH